MTEEQRPETDDFARLSGRVRALELLMRFVVGKALGGGTGLEDALLDEDVNLLANPDLEPLVEGNSEAFLEGFQSVWAEYIRLLGE